MVNIRLRQMLGVNFCASDGDLRKKDLMSKYYKFVLENKAFFLYIIFCLIASLALLIIPYLYARKNLAPKKEVSNNKPERVGQELIQEEAHELMEIRLSYNDSTEQPISVLEIKRKFGYLGDDLLQDHSGYRLEIYENDNNLDHVYFNVPNQVIGPPPSPDSPEQETIGELGRIELKKLEFVVTTPFYEKANKIIIYNADSEEILNYEIENIRTDFREFNVQTKANVLSYRTDIIEPIEKMVTRVIPNTYAQTTKDYVNVVFLSEDYGGGQMEQYKSDVNKMIDHLMEYEPFKSRVSQFLFHIVENTSDLGCSYYGRAIVCDPGRVISAANNAAVPYDVVAVVVNNSTYGGAAYYPGNGNAGIAISYNGEAWSREVFVHEFGHALAVLEDEYIANNPNERGEKNCYNGIMAATRWEDLTQAKDYLS